VAAAAREVASVRGSVPAPPRGMRADERRRGRKEEEKKLKMLTGGPLFYVFEVSNQTNDRDDPNL